VVDDQHPNGVPFEQWVNAPQQEPVTQMRGNALARWAHEQEEPPDTGWQRDWQRGYETARRWVRQVGLPSLAQQEAPKGGGNLPPPLQAEPVANASSWFALVMNAAAEIEDASHCLRDEAAKRVAISGAKHYRDAANALFAATPRREWQGLSEEDMEDLLPLYSDPSANTEMLEFAAAIEVKLKEKNA
jgi:hypothetical protein